jgi:extradiol dioxygenase family protein
MPPFHLALPVTDLEAARAFYAGVLGCGVGRESDRWIDFDFFGHQVTVHLIAPDTDGTRVATNPVDGDDVPVRHFGCILDRPTWDATVARLRDAGIRFVIEPHVRFAGRVGEQATAFFLDPSGNALELKSFRDPADVFRRDLDLDAPSD